MAYYSSLDPGNFLKRRHLLSNTRGEKNRSGYRCAISGPSVPRARGDEPTVTGRRRLLAVNIAMFSLMMPIVALSPGFSVFIAARALSTFAMNGEWALGSMLVAETWPPHLRGRVISINRATWCFGASFAGAIAGLIAGTWGWRAAVMVPGVIALLAIYVRATCPESPYWVRTQDRKRRIADTLAAGGALSAEDRTWY